MFIFIFFDVDPVKTFELALGCRKVTQQLGKLVEANVKFLNSTSWVSGYTDKLSAENGPLADYGVHMIRRLLESGLTPEQVTWGQILPVAGAMVANQVSADTGAFCCGSAADVLRHLLSMTGLLTCSHRPKSSLKFSITIS